MTPNELDRIMREVIKDYEDALKNNKFGQEAKQQAERIRSLIDETKEK